MIMFISGTIISAGKTVMASEYKGRATVAMGKEVENLKVTVVSNH